MIYYLYARPLGGTLCLAGFVEEDRFCAQKEDLYVGEFELDLTLDEYKKKAAPGIISGLEEQKDRLMAEAHAKVKAIDEQMASLQCLEHKEE